MNKEHNIIFHADDFGANREISEHILDCFRDGALNSLSVLPNSPHLTECMDLLEAYRQEIAVSLHLNLAEGSCLAEPESIPLLIDERGMFSISFFKLLLLSYTPKRKELKRQLQREMKAQIRKILPYVSELRLDSHQHYHMIPIVLDSIFAAIKELEQEGICVPEVAFLRIPAEPLLPFLKHPKLWGTYRPINFIKNMVLNVLNMADKKRLSPYRKKTAVFWGILMSGKMDLERISVLKKDFLKIVEKRGLPLEILAHPGGAERPDELLDAQNRGCVEFYLDEGRRIEKKMLREAMKRVGE